MLLIKTVVMILGAAIPIPCTPDPDSVRATIPRPVQLVRYLDSDRVAWLESDERSKSGAVVVWDLRQRRPAQVFAGRPERYRRGLVVLSERSGELRLVTADKVWRGAAGILEFDVVSGRERTLITVRSQIKGGEIVQALEAIPADGPLAVGCLDAGIRFWWPEETVDIPVWSPAKPLAICSLTASPDGRLLVVGTDRPNLGVWEWKSRRLAYTVSGDPNWGGLISHAFSPDGRFLATGMFGGPVLLWDAATGRPRGRFIDHHSSVEELTFSPDSKTLAVIHVDGTLVVWELLTGKPRLRIRLGYYSRSVSFAPDGGQLCVGGSRVVVYDPWASSAPASPPLAAWRDLGSPDAAVAFRAMQQLVRLPDEEWAKFRPRLPKPKASPDAIDRLVADLSHDNYTMREQAERELTDARFWAERRLRQARDAVRSLEAQTRLDRILARMSYPSDPEVRRVSRLIEVLRRTQGEQASRLLRDIGKHYPDLLFGPPSTTSREGK